MIFEVKATLVSLSVRFTGLSLERKSVRREEWTSGVFGWSGREYVSIFGEEQEGSNRDPCLSYVQIEIEFWFVAFI